eukprot:Filipodium_phascolosomae@DN1348_c0_g1_i1.p2
MRSRGRDSEPGRQPHYYRNSGSSSSGSTSSSSSGRSGYYNRGGGGRWMRSPTRLTNTTAATNLRHTLSTSDNSTKRVLYRGVDPVMCQRAAQWIPPMVGNPQF